jgi:hypothetical protein
MTIQETKEWRRRRKRRIFSVFLIRKHENDRENYFKCWKGKKPI